MNRYLAKLIFVGFALSMCFSYSAHANSRPDRNENNVWYVENSSDTVFIFIHGIFSDSRNAWSDGITEKSPYWPRLVHSDEVFDNPSIFLGGFYTEFNSGYFDFRDAADQLYQAIATGVNPVLNKRKIVFVTHSTGGIVARQLLVKYVDKFVGKKVGLVLIASPSLGSSYATKFSTLASWFNQQMGLQLQWSSPDLISLDSEFRQLIDNKKIPGLIGVEAIENHSLIGRKLLVEEKSGARYFGSPTRLANTNHFETVKPNSVRHPSHIFLRDFYQNRFQIAPTPEIPLSDEKWSSLRVQVHTFHSTHSLNSWGLLEVRLFDPAGKQIDILNVDTSSCWADCKGVNSARRENLLDGLTALQVREKNVFWAPTEKKPDDAREWVKFYFNESRVGSIEIHQWFEGGCMENCSEKNKQSGDSKIRAYANSVLVSLYKGGEKPKDAAYWITMADDRIVTTDIPFP